MSKSNQEFQCKQCGGKFPKWSGRCNLCKEWETLEPIAKNVITRNWISSSKQVQSLDQVVIDTQNECWPTYVQEVDRVLGKGIVKGSIGLLGGAPGIGKSTLILQLLSRLSLQNKKVLYISGEESLEQIKSRADRLTLQKENIFLVIESNLEVILEHIQTLQPEFVVIDSIQTLYSEKFPSSSGSVTQVKETATILLQQAKHEGTSVMLIGHITKEGSIAGPKTLEHMVDYVLYLEGEQDQEKRVLRAVKNRFGPVNEIGFFKMTPKGLAESKSNHCFQENQNYSGTCIFPALEGSRVLLLEIQALVGDTAQKNPARTTLGIDKNRLQLLVAILEKHLQVDFSLLDIYVSIGGGFRITDPLIDMAVMTAILSSHLNIPVPQKSVYLGEATLTGEFRSVGNWQNRFKEADRNGFVQFILPKATKIKQLPQTESIELQAVKNIQDLNDFFQTAQ